MTEVIDLRYLPWISYVLPHIANFICSFLLFDTWRKRIGFFVFVLILTMNAAASAHDSWINKQGFQNKSGEWCCGAGDCGRYVKGRIVLRRDGYELSARFRIGEGAGAKEFDVDEFVPESQTLPASDGDFWYCRRPDHSRRCFFGPPPGT